jgi:hypothetical protein
VSYLVRCDACGVVAPVGVSPSGAPILPHGWGTAQHPFDEAHKQPGGTAHMLINGTWVAVHWCSGTCGLLVVLSKPHDEEVESDHRIVG